MKYNSLTFIGKCQLFGLSKLMHLDLSYNELKKYPNHSFAGLSVLNYLPLQGNRISEFGTIQLNIFQPLSRLEELNIEGLCLPRGHYSSCVTIDEHLCRVPSLKKLYVDTIVFNHLGPGFSSLKHFGELYFISGSFYQQCVPQQNI